MRDLLGALQDTEARFQPLTLLQPDFMHQQHSLKLNSPRPSLKCRFSELNGYFGDVQATSSGNLWIALQVCLTLEKSVSLEIFNLA